MQGQKGASNKQRNRREAPAMIAEPSPDNAYCDNQKIWFEGWVFMACAQDKKSRSCEE